MLTMPRYYIVSENTDVEMFEEFSNIIKWSADNKLTVNLTRTKKIVFHRPNLMHHFPPAAYDVTERVAITKLLGV